MAYWLRGTLTVGAGAAAEVRAALSAHIEATRAEPGCLCFEVKETAPGVFDVAERFADRDAFAAHQARTATTPWAAITKTAHRDYHHGED